MSTANTNNTNVTIRESLLVALRDIDLTRAIPDYASNANSPTVAQLSLVFRRFEQNPDSLPRLTQGNGGTTQSVDRLVEALQQMGNQTQSGLKDREICERVIKQTLLGAKMTSPSKRLKHGMAALDVYDVFNTCVFCLTQLNINPDNSFTVMDFIKGDCNAAKFTTNVWATIDTVFHWVLDESFIAIGEPKVTLENVRGAAQMDSKLQQLRLLTQLWDKALVPSA